jgi:hypothetical protein
VYAARLRAILGDIAALADIRDAIVAGFDYADPILPALPSYAAEIAVTAVDLLGVDWPPLSKENFLAAQLRSTDAIARFTGLNPLRLQLGSAWRPPEHNESPSITPISNHQIGEAFDKQPLGSGQGARNPLAQLCLHMAGQDLYGTSLREMLLENQAAAYLSLLVDTGVDADGIARRRYVVIANFDADLKAEFRLRAPDGTEEELPTESVLDGEVITTGTRQLSSRLAQAFLDEYARHTNTSGVWPVPPPTYLEVYLFGLTVASHVHFTWNL